MRTTRLTILIAIIIAMTSVCALVAIAQPAKSAQINSSVSQIVTTLRAEFRKRNPNIGRIDLFDIRPLLLNPINYPERPNNYLIIARGVRSDYTYRGTFDDELLGIFILDDSLYSIKRVIDLIPSERWGDWIIKVVRIWKDSVTVRGEDIERGPTDFVRRYYLLK